MCWCKRIVHPEDCHVGFHVRSELWFSMFTWLLNLFILGFWTFSCAHQGCVVGVKISDSNSDLYKISDSDSHFIKFHTPTPDSGLSKFPTPCRVRLLNIKGMKFGFQNQWKSWCTATNLFQQEFQKKLYHSNRNSQFWSVCHVKNDPIGHPESESDKNIRLWLSVLLGIRLHRKNSDSLRLRLRLRNPGSHVKFKVQYPVKLLLYPS